MRKRFFLSIPFVVILVLFSINVYAHCEIPCGIYDDPLRVKMIYEHCNTIEKSMNMILELQKQKSLNYNQLARWISNKEQHAIEIQEIVAQYFMTQRIKPDTKQYADKLGILHQMLVSAMKCKQTTDVSHVTMLRDLMKKFEGIYFK